MQPELFEPVHESLQPRRLSEVGEHVYLQKWQEANRRRPAVNRGYTSLEWILCPEGKSPLPVTQRDATVAACLVQWLGTNCGRAFIWSAEREIATVLHYDAERERLLLQQPEESSGAAAEHLVREGRKRDVLVGLLSNLIYDERQKAAAAYRRGFEDGRRRTWVPPDVERAPRGIALAREEEQT
jgi:hypothetical protein